MTGRVSGLPTLAVHLLSQHGFWVQIPQEVGRCLRGMRLCRRALQIWRRHRGVRVAINVRIHTHSTMAIWRIGMRLRLTGTVPALSRRPDILKGIVRNESHACGARPIPTSPSNVWLHLLRRFLHDSHARWTPVASQLPVCFAHPPAMYARLRFLKNSLLAAKVIIDDMFARNGGLRQCEARFQKSSSTPCCPLTRSGEIGATVTCCSRDVRVVF
jgi:hypothetical protein